MNQTIIIRHSFHHTTNQITLANGNNLQLTIKRIVKREQINVLTGINF